VGRCAGLTGCLGEKIIPLDNDRHFLISELLWDVSQRNWHPRLVVGCALVSPDLSPQHHPLTKMLKS
jgi:hypothetical protein